MKRAVWCLGIVSALAGLSAGCAPIQKDAGFHDVQSAIRERSGFQTYWDQQAPEGTSEADRVRSMLEQDLTESSAVEIALLNNRGLQATFEELGIGRADLIQAGLIRNPILAGEIRFPSSPFEITLTQTIVDLFTLRRRKDLAAAAFEATKLRVGTQVLDVVAEVRSAFYTLQSGEQTLEMRRSILDAARTSAELAIRQHEAGNISDLDVENAQAQFEQSKLDFARAENAVLLDREKLNELMGVWGEKTNWKTSEKLPDLPADEGGLDALESRAVSQRLDLASARQEVEVASRALPLARSGVFADATVGVHHEREPDGERSTGPALDIPLPLFNRGKAARLRAEAVLRQAEHRYAALAVKVRSEVRVARSRVQAARTRAEYYRDVVLPRRARIIDLSQRNYNFMLIGSFQLLFAKQSEIAAKSEYLEALRDYWVSRTELDRALGGSLHSVVRDGQSSTSPGPADGHQPEEQVHLEEKDSPKP